MYRKVFVQNADLITFPCDVLILRYAQRFYSSDGLVASLFLDDTKQPPNITPRPGEYVILPSRGKLSADQLLFLGSLDLHRFDYGQMRAFSRYAMRILSSKMPQARHVAMTLYGIGYKLNEEKSLLAQIAGLFDASNDGAIPASLDRITIVEGMPERAARLENILEQYLNKKERKE